MLVRDDKAQCSCSGPDEPHLMASSSSSGREWMGEGRVGGNGIGAGGESPVQEGLEDVLITKQ